jgi:hypothetical protein
LTSEWELLLLSLKITKLRIWPIDTSTSSILCLRYVYCLYSPSFIICLSCNSWLVFLSGSSIPCFSPSSPRGRGHLKCACFRGLRSPRGWG